MAVKVAEPRFRESRAEVLRAAVPRFCGGAVPRFPLAVPRFPLAVPRFVLAVPRFPLAVPRFCTFRPPYISTRCILQPQAYTSRVSPRRMYTEAVGVHREGGPTEWAYCQYWGLAIQLLHSVRVQ